MVQMQSDKRAKIKMQPENNVFSYSLDAADTSLELFVCFSVQRRNVSDCN
jgi:hypothetical protein